MFYSVDFPLPFFDLFVFTNVPSMLLPLGGLLTCTTAWYKYPLRIVVLFPHFLSSIIVRKFCSISLGSTDLCISINPVTYKAWSFPTQRNDSSSSICVGRDNVSSHTASSNHSCVWHLSIALPLSPSVMLE